MYNQHFSGKILSVIYFDERKGPFFEKPKMKRAAVPTSINCFEKFGAFKSSITPFSLGLNKLPLKAKILEAFQDS